MDLWSGTFEVWQSSWPCFWAVIPLEGFGVWNAHLATVIGHGSLESTFEFAEGDVSVSALTVFIVCFGHKVCRFGYIDVGVWKTFLWEEGELGKVVYPEVDVPRVNLVWSRKRYESGYITDLRNNTELKVSASKN